MFKLFSRRATVALSAGVAVLAAGAALPAQASAVPGWRISASVPVHNRVAVLTTVDAVSARDAWSAGFALPTNGAQIQTLIRHWNGKSWTSVALPSKVATAWNKTQPLADQIGASSPTNVWIFASLLSSAYLRLNGNRWSVGHLPGPKPSSGKLLQINAVRVFSRSNVWAVGGTTNLAAAQPTTVPYAAHFNGHRWSVTPVPGNTAITSVSAVSGASIWAVAGAASPGVGGPGGATGKQIVLHWGPKGGWQQLAAQPALPAGSHLSAVLVASGKVVVGGSEPNGRKGRSPLMITWNGKAWSAPSVAGASPTKWNLAGLASDGRGGTWVLGFHAAANPGKLWHVVHGKWTAVQPGFGKHAWFLEQIVAVPHTDSVWGAGALREGKLAVALMAVAGPTPR